MKKVYLFQLNNDKKFIPVVANDAETAKALATAKINRLWQGHTYKLKLLTNNNGGKHANKK